MTDAAVTDDAMTGDAMTAAAGAATTCANAIAGDPTSVLHRWLGMSIGFRWLNAALFARVTQGTGLPESSFQVLCYLLNQPDGSAPMTRLARHIEFSTAGITKVTDRLVAAGLIQRGNCPTDRRIVYAVLTDAGRSMAHQAHQLMGEALQDLMIDRIGRRDFDRLAEIMAKLHVGPPARP